MTETKTTYNELHVIFFFLFILVVSSVGFFIKKVVFSLIYNEKLKFFKTLSIQKITNIAMIIAMNTALIFIFSWLSGGLLSAFFRVYPGSRMLIENTLIKIGGILFGPILGIFIGLTTDLLTVILTSSVLNYGYWLSAMINGFWGGVIYLLINMSPKSKRLKSTICVVVIAIFSLISLYLLLDRNIKTQTANLNILSVDLNLNKSYIFWIVFLISGACVMQMIISVFCNFLIEKEQYKKNKFIHFYSKRDIFFQIISVNVSCYIIVDIISLPIFDQIFSSLPYEQFVIMRVLLAIPFLFISSLIIWNIYKLKLKINKSPIKIINQRITNPKLETENIIFKIAH